MSAKRDVLSKIKQSYNSKWGNADLHIHTIHSDGDFDLEDIMEFAELSKMDTICVTDHNTIYPAYKRFQSIDQSKYFSGKVLFGVEIGCKYFSTVYNKYLPIEILAYNLRCPKSFEDFLSYTRKQADKTEQLNYLKGVCDKLGLVYSKELLPKEGYVTETLMADLSSHEENLWYFKEYMDVWKNPKLFYKKMCTCPISDFYIDTTLELKDVHMVMEEIHRQQGVGFLAHPYLYVFKDDESVLKMIDNIQSHVQQHRLDGIECLHSAHTLHQRDVLLKYCREHDLKYSGGADFHSGEMTLIGYGEHSKPICLTTDMFPWLKQ